MNRSVFKRGRLIARPDSIAATHNVEKGVQPLSLVSEKDGLLYIPDGYNHNQPAKLAVMLHGAGGHATHGLELLLPYASAYNIILVAPASRKYTWDIIADDAFGTDVLFINQALELVFGRYHVDAGHIAIGGFSDGASYALCLGLSNGDLFTHSIAFSPGFCYTIENSGKPAVFISHGIHDGILPIDLCSRKLVPRLQRLGYAVAYTEFDGEHVIPTSVAKTAVGWFAGK